MAKGKKTGGREQGTPNLLTKELRSILKSIISKELELLPETLEKLEPEKRTEIVLKLLPFVLPKVEPVIMEKGEPLDLSATWNEF
ncbi:MAG TPA: hypothetical protein PKW80_12120 [Bacteroidales bacterium]|nr:hypothetical protein [Bacteroidales bacterium]